MAKKTKSAREAIEAMAEDMDIHRCANCDSTWFRDQLRPIDNLLDRIEEGGIVPSGECSACGALCYPEDDDEREETPEEAENRKEIRLAYLGKIYAAMAIANTGKRKLKNAPLDMLAHVVSNVLTDGQIKMLAEDNPILEFNKCRDKLEYDEAADEAACPYCDKKELHVKSVIMVATGEKHWPTSKLGSPSRLYYSGFEVDPTGELGDLKDQSTTDEVIECQSCSKTFPLHKVKGFGE